VNVEGEDVVAILTRRGLLQLAAYMKNNENVQVIRNNLIHSDQNGTEGPTNPASEGDGRWGPMDKGLKNQDSGKNQRFSESFVHWKHLDRYSKKKVRKKFGPKVDRT
jgi:hypothetical protein